jgi:hypothetical protein
MGTSSRAGVDYGPWPGANSSDNEGPAAKKKK